MKGSIALFLVAGLSSFVFGCGSIKQYQTLQQPAMSVLRASLAGTILRIDKQESLPNAYGGADIWGGKRPRGSTELKYLGLTENGMLKLRLITTDITTNENWRRRFDRSGFAVASTDPLDFEFNPKTPLDVENITVHFLDVTATSVSYRLVESKSAESGSKENGSHR